jgi:HEAT repeat protein
MFALIKMGRILKKISRAVFAFSFIGLVFMTMSCASSNYQPTDSELATADTEALKDLWLKSSSSGSRSEIAQEFERRKSLDGLLFCLYWATRQQTRKTATGQYTPFAGSQYRYHPAEGYRQAASKSKFTTNDVIEIVGALGRIKDPEAAQSLNEEVIHSLKEAVLRVQSKEFSIAVLGAYKEIGSPQAVSAAVEFLKDPDPEIRFLALDTLGYIKSSERMEDVFPLLLDTEANIRWKAIHTLGEIGNPRAADRIGFLLEDPDESVRGIAENVLKKFGISAEQIADWKQKAGQLSIDEVYRTKLAYQRAEIEKQELAKKLESEKDLKNQLEESLKSRETALEKQKKLVEALYDKERELKSKLAQLDIARGQSGEYQRELEQLNIRVQTLNAELKQARGKAAAANVKQELNKTLEEKSQLETDIKMSQEKESKLREEVASLSAMAEQTRLEAEDAKKQLAATRDREAELTRQVDELKARLNRGMAPVLVVSKPEGGTTVRMPFTMLQAVAVDDKGISDFQVTLNDQPVMLSSTRGIKVTAAEEPEKKKMVISEKLQLGYGQNIIKVTATDTDGITTEEIITITRDKEHGDLWAAVIGINDYPNARGLKYAVNDALAFKNYLSQNVGVPENNIFLLTDQNATKENIQHLLGTKLKRQTAKEDTVIIFYAGHGAVETDPSNPDGDGFEKYLLPYDANLNDLYTTSISMDEVRKIFNRISAERLIFIADTCYSGASGGRTLVTSKTRANLSDKFHERIAKGKGRVIISSCSANEISKEDDSLQHGVFSYHMLEGLKGLADQDGDGIITVSELFSYISRKVPEASAQDQHPVKKGETEGELVIGRIK